ncbi:Dimethylamine corrinoid protein 1 [Rhodovastum atsumiense]|uniref:Cobalamin-binding protein n=1 Tax=Rhodovastum atsumiense TaxID=504468 RepID=A0A5M6IQN7_9PROT|nr:corrinoid protein [Rhodovastum atsumiense]KAA5609878.1 cobalamin-binding protein [Rhodovastum atsumiense]CAH2602421.1 Dimethylamine corrinoid protein 1 [Rhodovastum atsumiense]
MPDSLPASPQALHEALATAVLELDEALTVQLAEQVIARGLDAWTAIEEGLIAGMNRAGTLFDEEEYFVPELLIASDAMYAGLAVLRPHIRNEQAGHGRRVVIGVVQGDTHDIGKNLVRIMLEAAGFEVFDLGRDVPAQNFIDRAVEVRADLIALSTLMTTTMEQMAQVVRLLEAGHIRERFKVIVGGAPISQHFAERIGADGYAPRAAQAVQLARRLTGLVAAA